jgi:tetratricopeptide (TPR) repeat protein
MELLKAFVSRHTAAPDAGTDGDTKAATVDVKKLPSLDTRVVAEEPAPTDFRAQLKRASEAASSGDLDTAKRLYNKVLESHPSNTEALAGLADIARRRGETTAAQNLYDRVLAQNPSYLPALMGSADQRWASGDRAGAVKLYRRVVEQAGAGTGYGQRAAQHIAEFEGSVPSRPERAAPRAEEPSAPEPSPGETAPDEEPADNQPHIDTTDLPEFNQ